MITNTRKNFKDACNDVRYVKGRVKEILTTKGGNTGVKLENAAFVFPIEGGGHFLRTVENRVFILVPKRKETMVEKAWSINDDNEYLFRMARESHSKKMVVTDIYIWS